MSLENYEQTDQAFEISCSLPLLESFEGKQKVANESQIAKPHDKIFKATLQYSELISEFLQHHLPQVVVEQVDLKTLRHERLDHLDGKLNLRKMDTAFSLAYKKACNSRLLINIEHQRVADRYLPFRCAQYHLDLMSNFKKNNPSEELPLVYSMVLFQQNKSYPYSSKLQDIVTTHPKLKSFGIQSDFQLIELTKLDENEMVQYPWTACFEYVLKHIDDLDFLSRFDKFLEKVTLPIANDRFLDFIVQLCHYIAEVSSIEDDNDFQAIITKWFGHTVKESNMTLVDKWLQQGIKIGTQQGMQQGADRMVKRIEENARALGFNSDQIKAICDLGEETGKNK